MISGTIANINSFSTAPVLGIRNLPGAGAGPSDGPAVGPSSVGPWLGRAVLWGAGDHVV